MQFKHLRSKISEAKKDLAGRMSLDYGSQRQDKLALDPGETEMSRLNPLRKDLNSPPKDTSKIPNQQDREDAEKEKNNQDVQGHSINKGRGWEGKVGTIRK